MQRLLVQRLQIILFFKNVSAHYVPLQINLQSQFNFQIILI